MKPIEAFERALFYVSGLSSHIIPKNPGAVLARLSQEAREALKRLTSSDIAEHTRFKEYWRYFESDENYHKKQFEKDKLEFDKKMLKK